MMMEHSIHPVSRLDCQLTGNLLFVRYKKLSSSQIISGPATPSMFGIFVMFTRIVLKTKKQQQHTKQQKTLN